jgi:DNA polymerase
MADSAEILEWIHSLVVGCRRCSLSQSRRNTVAGEGNPTADLMLVGEAPGAAEDAQGRPFVGPSGRLLTSLLAEIGVRREEVFITSVVKCRPPANREPREEEIAACSDYLLGQIAAIKPKIIATLGRHAAQALIAPDFSISRSHGKPYFQEGILFVPMFHPAYALHDQSQREVVKEDMQALGDLMVKNGLIRPRGGTSEED